MNQPKQPDQNANSEHRTKGSPPSDPGQAVESGEPTITGDAPDKTNPQSKPGQPKEGAHWESGQK
jgi:hypothetical protein